MSLFRALVLALPLAALLVLAVPVRVSLRAEKEERFAGSLTVRWLFGIVLRRFPLPASARSGRPPAPRGEEAAMRRGPAGTKRGARAALAALWTPGFPSRLLGLLRSLGRRFRVESLHLSLRGGLPDPAATGRLCGAVAAAAALVPGRVAFTPDWTAERLAGRGDLGLVFVPLGLLLSLGGFALHPVTFRALRRAAREARR